MLYVIFLLVCLFVMWIGCFVLYQNDTQDLISSFSLTGLINWQALCAITFLGRLYESGRS